MTRLHQIIDNHFQTFRTKSQSSKLTILHPHGRYRSPVVAKILQSTDDNAYYYALGPDDINLVNFLNGITHALSSQHLTFGRHLNILHPDVFQEPFKHIDQILMTFVKELEELSTEPFYLILDDYDRSDRADDLQKFISRLINVLPEQCKVVISGRKLPRIPFVSMIASRQAILLRDSDLIRQDFYNFGHPDEYDLEIFALGPGYVTLNEKYIEEWEGHLPRLLLFYALDRHVVTRSEICRDFWPELDEEQAVNVFHVTKRRLHKALDLDILDHTGRYYHLNKDVRIYYDVLDFIEKLMIGRDESLSAEERFQAYDAAARLYRRAYLFGNDEDWVIEKRTPYATAFSEATQFIGNYWKENGRADIALNIYQSGIEEVPTDPMLHQELFQAYVEMGRRVEAVTHYQDATKLLKRAGEIQTESAQTLYAEITT